MRTPILRDAPVRTSGIVGFQVPERQNPLKNRAQRAPGMQRNPAKIANLAPGNAKNEGHAKTTYSIPDFLSRDKADVMTDSLFGAAARERVYLRPDSERESDEDPFAADGRSSRLKHSRGAGMHTQTAASTSFE